jgi:hypothetical protein
LNAANDERQSGGSAGPLIDKEELELCPVPAGASGAAAIYTDRAPSFKMVRRVMLRWYTWLNYIKLSL